MLDAKRLVVIGGTTGMGRAAARAFVKNEAFVVAVGLDETSAAETQAELGESRCHAFSADARQAATAERAIEICLEKWGGLDGLYHVAGGSGRRLGDGPLHDLTDDGWQATLDLNLTSMMLSNRAAVRQFLKQQTGGAILNMASVLAFSPAPEHFSTHAYAAAKAGAIGFSKSIAAFYATQNIRVNVVAPALVDTPMAARAMQNIDIQSFIKKKQPLDGGRTGLPEDLDGLAVLLMSDAARFITGQVVAVDGGWSVG